MKKWHAILVTTLLLALDQISKYWVLNHLVFHKPRPVCPMFNLTLAFNSGSAFSFLSQAGSWHHWFFLLFGASMSLFLVIWMIRLPREESLSLFSLSCILSGALGNLIDRIRFGYVIDFIQIYYQNFSWPVFNIADSAICVGALLLCVNAICLSKNPKPKERLL